MKNIGPELVDRPRETSPYKTMPPGKERDARLKACWHKASYISHDIAMKLVHKRAHQTGVHLFVYKCQFCPGYHLTRKLHAKIA